ncbi:MAG: hypothetical protein H6825_02555 [Planctomycetes bacterium]|nr:hypothetical protein [Planctomycetota bacterium]
MTQIDRFESVFRAADKPVFRYEALRYGRVLLVTDLAHDEAERVLGRVRPFLAAIDGDDVAWATVTGDRFADVGTLVDVVERAEPDLIVTWRHLHGDAWRFPYGLGTYLEVLTQHTRPPVLVLPHPRDRALPHALVDTDRVLAITGELAGDGRLVNTAFAFTRPGGTCWLTHVEDAATFERYMREIAKIPEIDTETARGLLAARLLHDAEDYVVRCREGAAEAGLDLRVEGIVRFGARVAEYERLVVEHEADLLVMNTRDDDQLAMNGRVHPLAVQLRAVPLLML